MGSVLKDLGRAFRLSKQYYIAGFFSAKMLLTFLIEASFIFAVYKNIGTWLRYTDKVMGVFELFPYNFTQDIPFLVIVIGVIIIVSDLPCISERTRFEITRMNARTYMLGQLFYLVFISITYFLFIWSVMLLIAAPKLSLNGEWSYFIETATKGTDFLNNNIDLVFPVWLMESYSPLKAFMLSIILGVLFSLFVGNVVMLFNIKLRYLNIATVVCMVFVVFDVAYTKIKVSIFKYIYYISPISMMKVYSYTTSESSIRYAMLFLGVGSIILFLWNIIIVSKKGIDLEV